MHYVCSLYCSVLQAAADYKNKAGKSMTCFFQTHIFSQKSTKKSSESNRHA